MTINYPTGESCTNVHEFWLMRTGLQGGQDSEKYGRLVYIGFLLETLLALLKFHETFFSYSTNAL